MLRHVHRGSNASLARGFGYPCTTGRAPCMPRSARAHHQEHDRPAVLQFPVASTAITEELEAKKAIKDARRRFKKKFWLMGFPFLDADMQKKLDDWNERGPPPLSKYRLSFGKYCGMKLDEVPLTYLVKYLIPRRRDSPTFECPIVGDAIDDYMRRHPDVKSQAGRKKVRPVAVADERN